MAEVATNVVEAPKRLPENMFRMQEDTDYLRSAVTLPVGWAFEEVLNPDFWVNIAPKFGRDQFTGRPEKLGTVISVRAQDHAFYGEVYVRAVVGKGLIVGVVMEPVYFGGKNLAPTLAGYEVKWNVGKREFDIVNQATKTIAASVKTRELAQKWIDETRAAVRAA